MFAPFRRSASGWRSFAPAVAYVLVLVSGAFLSYYELHTVFMTYDDEGNLLVSLQSFLHGGHLYDDVFTQYGPFYYEVFGGLFKLTGREVSTDAGRLIVGAIWLATGTIYGLTLHRLTSRASIGVATLVVTFGVLPLLVFEPMHPVGLVGLLIALVVAAASLASVGPVPAAIALGLLVGFLAMTKVNIGGLAFVAVLFAAGVSLPGLRERLVVRRGAVALLVGVPIFVLLPDGRLDSVQIMAILVTGGAVALAAVCTLPPGDGEDPAGNLQGGPFLRAFLSGFTVAILVSAVIILALGSSLGGLVRGVLIDPTHLRNVFTIPFSAPSSAVNWAIGGAIAALIVRRARLVGLGAEPRMWTACVRVLAGLLVWLSVIGASAIVMQHGSGARLMLPLAASWLVAVPVGGAAVGAGQRFVRALLPALAVLETVQAYPVAGTQTLSAALVFVPCGALLLHDGAVELQAVGRLRRPDLAALSGGAIRLGLVAVVVAFAVATIVRPVQAQHTLWANNAPLRVHGGTKVRLEPGRAAELGRLVGVIRSTCSQFISYPGIESLYLWANRRPPTGFNAGDWMELVSSRAQARIVRAVRNDPRVCVVRNQNEINVWLTGKPPPQRPLVRYIEAYFKPTETFLNGEYELMRRR